MSINYGLNRVRFPAPVPVDSRIRARFAVKAVETLERAIRVTWGATVEREHGDKPCCVADLVFRYYN